MTDTRAFRTAVTGGPTRAVRGNAPQMSRAGFYGNGGNVVSRAGSKADDEDKVQKPPAPDGEEDDDKEKKAKGDDDMVMKGQAGSAGDFKPMGGTTDAWDNNSDKGEGPANNDTGVPDTPSGI